MNHEDLMIYGMTIAAKNPKITPCPIRNRGWIIEFTYRGKVHFLYRNGVVVNSNKDNFHGMHPFDTKEHLLEAYSDITRSVEQWQTI